MKNSITNIFSSVFNEILKIFGSLFSSWLQAYTKGDWLELAMVSLVILIVAILIGLVIFIIYLVLVFLVELADTAFTPIHTTTGKVVGRYKEEDDDFMAVSTAPLTSVMYIDGDTERFLQVEFCGIQDIIEVRKRVYKQIKIGDRIRVWYRTGRFSDRIYLHAVDA